MPELLSIDKSKPKKCSHTLTEWDDADENDDDGACDSGFCMT